MIQSFFTELTLIFRLAEFRQLEKHLVEQLAVLEAMKGDEGLRKEVEFETRLRALLAEYDYRLRNVMAILDPQASQRATAEVPKQLARHVKSRSTKTRISAK